jgi:hypothetical protein
MPDQGSRNVCALPPANHQRDEGFPQSESLAALHRAVDHGEILLRWDLGTFHSKATAEVEASAVGLVVVEE